MIRISILLVLLPTLSYCGLTLEPTQRPTDEPQILPELSSGQLFTRGVALAKHGQLIRAEQYLYLAAQRGYPEEQTLPLLLKICLSTSRLRTGLNYAKPYLTRHPESWKLRYLVAAIYLALEQPEHAVHQLDRVVHDNPDHAPSYYLLAIISRDALRNEASARQHFIAYLEHDPTGTHADEATVWLREHRIDSQRATRRNFDRRRH